MTWILYASALAGGYVLATSASPKLKQASERLDAFVGLRETAEPREFDARTVNTVPQDFADGDTEKLKTVEESASAGGGCCSTTGSFSR